MSEKIHIASEEEMKFFASNLAMKLESGKTILLSGDLGTGKTTFSQYFLKALGVQKVTSPTFAIFNEYDIDHGSVNRAFHFDLYRLGSTEELEELGFYEIVEDKLSHVLVEWPEKAEVIMPEDAIRIEIEHGKDDESRTLLVSGI